MDLVESCEESWSPKYAICEGYCIFHPDEGEPYFSMGKLHDDVHEIVKQWLCNHVEGDVSVTDDGDTLVVQQVRTGKAVTFHFRTGSQELEVSVS